MTFQQVHQTLSVFNQVAFERMVVSQSGTFQIENSPNGLIIHHQIGGQTFRLFF